MKKLKILLMVLLVSCVTLLFSCFPPPGQMNHGGQKGSNGHPKGQPHNNGHGNDDHHGK